MRFGNSDEIVPAQSTPSGADRQRGYKTARTKALWRLAQAAVNKPGEALSSTAVIYDKRRDAIVDASRIRLGRQGTVNNAVKALCAVGMVEAWAVPTQCAALWEDEQGGNDSHPGPPRRHRHGARSSEPVTIHDL